MSETKISNRYAQALMQEAIAENKLPAVAADMAVISKICAESKDLRNTLMNPVINQQQKLSALQSVFKGLDATVQGFIRLVCSKNRESLLPDIADAFLSQYRRHQGIEKVTVQSTAPVSKQDKQSIRQFIKQKTGAKEIELHTEINPDVIGGLVIKFGDNLLDSSIAAKLRKLKKELKIA